MPNLCKVLKELSEEIQEWLVAQPEVKEESLTDWLLYELSKRHPRVSYKSFTRHQEAKSTGADWDWVFVFNDGVVRLRVQAKKLFSGADNYPGLAKSNRYGQQITMLISSAATVSAYPIYALYSENSFGTACGGSGAPATGVYVCGANRVDSALVKVRKQIQPSDAIAISYPMACLACCPKAQGGSAKKLIKQIYRYFESEFESQDEAGSYQGYSEGIPASVSAVLESDFMFPEWWEREFEREYSQVSALVIVDGRG